MIIREEKMNLFDTPMGYHLAHCITGDYSMGAGIAKKMNEIHNMRQELKDKFPIPNGKRNVSPGQALLIGNVFNLVDKSDRYDPADYFILEEALIDMSRQMEELGIKKVAMPKIGCGMDRLEWDIVRGIIEIVFEGQDVEILVCVK